MIFLLLPSLPPTEAEAEGELPAAAGGGDRPQSSNIISASGFSGNETRSLSLASPSPKWIRVLCYRRRRSERHTEKKIIFFPGFSPFLFPL